jgi:hypothetical protein
MASSPHSLQPLLSLLIALSEFDKQDGVCAPAFCLVASDARLVFCTNRGNWEEYVKRLRRAPSLSAFGRSDRVPDALNLPLTQDAEAKKIVDLLERIPSSLISERVREQAGQLLSLAIERQQVLVFWPLADVYEALEGERRSARLEELGIAVHSVLAGGGSHEEDS